MRKNLIQEAKSGPAGRFIIPNDWYHGAIPGNFKQGENVYIDSSFGFDAFFSGNMEAMVMGRASACYDRATFVTSGSGKIEVGRFSILNGCTIICTDHVRIGDYVMLAWGSVIADNFMGADLCPDERGKILERNVLNEKREMPFSGSMPVTIGNNVWIGFDAVVLPGTKIGKGSVIGCKSVVSGDIPPYSVVVGNPGRIIKTLEPTDDMEKLEINP